MYVHLLSDVCFCFYGWPAGSLPDCCNNIIPSSLLRPDVEVEVQDGPVSVVISAPTRF